MMSFTCLDRGVARGVEGHPIRAHLLGMQVCDGQWHAHLNVGNVGLPPEDGLHFCVLLQ